jgi:hypothetical protein
MRSASVVALAILAWTAVPASAEAAAARRREAPRRTVTSGVKTGPAAGFVDTKIAWDTPDQARARAGITPPPQRCPGYASTGVEWIGGNTLSPIDATNPQPQYRPVAYHCDGVGWTIEQACVANCPDGTPTVTPQPNIALIRERFLALPIEPDPVLAPPLELGKGMALVGKKLYFSVNPTTYQTRTDNETTGEWFATGIATPKQLRFSLDGVEKTCEGPGPDPRTEAGRSESDRAGCWILVEQAPQSEQGPLTVSIDWQLTTITNIAALLGPPELVSTTVEITVPIQELQAVIIG